MLKKSLSSVQLFLGMGGRCHGERKSLILEIKTGDLRKCLKLGLKKKSHTTWMHYWNILECLMGDSKGERDTSSHEMLCPGR